MQRARAISSSGRKSPSRPLPPLPSRDPRTSPALRSISPRSTTVPPQLPFWPPVDTRDRSRSSLSRPAIANQATSSLLVSPVPRREPYSHQLQQDFIRRGRRPTPLRRRSATPDIKFQLHDLTGQITRDDENISEYGGYGSVWKGSLQPHGTKVAIKVLHSCERDRDKMRMRLRREIEIWKRLDHPNIVKLLGTTDDFGLCTGMVSLWMDNGNLTVFLEQTTASLSDSDRFELLIDVAAGLAYLHGLSKPVIHGDLSGANIVIDANRTARLIDFGLSSIKAEFAGTSYFSSTVGGALRWRAPELVATSEEDVAPVLSSACDIYSYGSIMLQVLSGNIPYHYLRADWNVAIALFRRVRPKRPMEPRVTDAYWEFIQLCWDEKQGARPHINEVNDRIIAFHHECINRNRCFTIRTTDGYETDSEASHVLTQSAKSSGCQSDYEGCIKSRKFAKKLRASRHSTLSFLTTTHSQRRTASPTVRVIDFQNLSAQSQRELINREISKLRTAVHANICNIIDIEASDVYTIRLNMEPITGMSLSDILQRSSPTKDQMSSLSAMIVNGLRHLHDLDIVHGNLNSGNVVLNTQGCVKLTSFGLSANEQSNHTELIDRPYWTAPEFFANRKYSSAMDIWSLGIVSIEMVEKQPPYFDKDPDTAREIIAGGATPALKNWQTLPWGLVEFLSSCLVGNSLKRATASELCSHEFLANACSTMTLVLLLDLELQRSF